MPLRRRITASVLLTLSVIASGCMTGGVEPPEGSPLYGDRAADGTPICENAAGDSPTNLACHDDCTRDCGFNGSPHYPRGVKYCVCEAGVFIECRCPKADWYKGAPMAPYCDKYTADGKGLTGSLKNLRCSPEWSECIARDVVDGFTPQGCVCMDKDGRGMTEWVCGSTEKWFYPEQ